MSCWPGRWISPPTSRWWSTATRPQYPRTPAEAADRWRQRIKYDILVLKSADKKEDKKEGQEARDKLNRRYNSFAKRMHQINSEELLEMYLNAFTMSFDPHTDYMSPRHAEELRRSP